jgi:RNA polymerase sigma-70 factor (ECF subfamily)
MGVTMIGKEDRAAAAAGSDRMLWEDGTHTPSEVFALLFERHARAIYNYCFRQTGSWASAEDLVSVVFLEAWRRRRDVSLHQDSALPWLHGVATNVCRNSLRGSRRHRAALRRITEQLSEPDPAEAVADRVDDERRMRELRAAIGTLPRREQEVLGLVVWSGLDYAAAAAALGVPVGTVRSRLFRARARLSSRLNLPALEETP